MSNLMECSLCGGDRFFVEVEQTSGFIIAMCANCGGYTPLPKPVERTCSMIENPKGFERMQGEELYPCYVVKCSECGDGIWDVNDNMKHCPTCGAKVEKRIDRDGKEASWE